ncbi:MAG: rod shape-determining protein MreC [Eubacteriales bacterium]
MRWFSQHKLNIIITMILLTLFISIGLTSQGRANTTIVESVVSKTASPVEKILYSSSQYLRNVYDFLQNLYSLKQRNEELEQRIDEFEIKIADYDQKVKENAELLELLQFKNENEKYDFISASVVGIDPYEGFQSFIIDKGSTKGITKDMTVVLNEGLVGRVSEVSLGTSKVLSIVDTDSMFNGKSVRTNDYVRIIGDTNNELIGYIDFEADITEDDMIVTSGLSGKFPPDIVIGKVKKVEEQTGKLEKLIRIEPAVDIEKVNKVLIIK